MYSRYGNDPKRPVRLPEHYGGSAFSQQPTAPASVPKRELTKSFPRDGIGEKASPVADRLLRAEAAEAEISAPPAVFDLSDEVTEETEAATSEPSEQPVSADPLRFGALRRLLGGGGEGEDADRDRLLLLGLILLLSRTEGDSDILLWLSLLLLCG